jgi:hypothetical protein
METLEEFKARLMQRAAQMRAAQMSSTPTGPRQNQKEQPPMAVLTDEIKEFIVKRLAQFEPPTKVAEAVGVDFGIEITRQQVHEYDPTGNKTPALRWRELHATTREKFLREGAEIGVSHKTVRLQMLDRLARRCERNSVALAISCLQLAAKECGGFYENRRPIVLQLPATEPSYARNEAAAATAKTISAAATIVSIGSEGARLSPLSGPLPARSNSATCADA